MRYEGESSHVPTYTGEVRDGQLIVHGAPRLLGGITCIDLGEGAPEILGIGLDEALAVRDIDLVEGGRIYGGRRLYLRNNSSVVTSVGCVGTVTVCDAVDPIAPSAPRPRKPAAG